MKKMRITQRDYIKANRRASREAEIENHTRPVNFCRVQKSKKVYDRKRSKAENKKALPYLFLYTTINFESNKYYNQNCVDLKRKHQNPLLGVDFGVTRTTC